MPLGDDLPATAEADPEAAFERVWLQEAVEHAIGRVREVFRARGQERRFQAYEAFALGAERPSYAQIADRLGLAVPEVEKALYLVREEIRRELRTEVTDEDEWRRLLGR
ncbi:MAG TPA: hypothetical protein VEJ18_12180 [Planctomycetota bacterium]|nr:hypothetical protein [Planctomycetota bacterium]